MKGKRVRCLFHKEDTPSLTLFEDGHYHCFGCGAHGWIDQYPELGTVELDEELGVKYVEDIKASLERISSLPKERYRSLELHFDQRGHYIVWPSNDYYKLRKRDAGSNSDKYRSPAGVSKRPFVLSPAAPATTAIVVEGELNAISIWEACKFYPIICPGAATDFGSQEKSKFVDLYSPYKRLIVYTDADKAGCVAAINFKVLMQQTHDVSIRLMERDFNEILQAKGKDGVLEFLKKDLEVRGCRV